MSTNPPTPPTPLARFVILFALSALLGALAFAAQPVQESQDPTMSAATARSEISAMYERWGRARIEYDLETMETILAPEFYAQVDDRRISRETFLRYVSQTRTQARLTRFDADILTVQQTEEGWTIVITEKLEMEIATPSGAPGSSAPAPGSAPAPETKGTLCSFWVTRDACRKVDGAWIVDSSEAIGHQEWQPNEKPPFRDW